MSTFHAHIKVINNSNADLTFEPGKSSGVDAHDWPSLISAGATAGPFEQGFDFQIKFTAVYSATVAGGPATASLQMYGDGVQVFNCSVSSDPATAFPTSYANATGSTSATFTVG